jgi:hypothetical protein
MDNETVNKQRRLGKDFLTYLCYKSDEQEGLFDIPGHSRIHLWIDSKIMLEDDSGMTPSTIAYSGEGFTADDLKQAIRSGKKVTEARLKIEKDEGSWTFVLKASTFEISGLRIYPPPFKSNDPDGQFYLKMLSIEQLNSMLDELYYLFLKNMTGKTWEHEGYEKFQSWVKG